MDTYPSMTELLRQVPAEGNYTVHVESRHRSAVKLFAPHGGCIEPCPGPLVRESAQERLDQFIFNGIRKKDCFRTLPVTSTNSDEPQCVAMARDACIALAFHGCEGEERFIEAGGGNVPLSVVLGEYLIGRGYDVRTTPKRRGGVDQNNFINLARK